MAVYEKAYIAVDPVIFSILDGKLVVHLNVREKVPYKGMYELPGALLLQKEDPELALKRKLGILFGGSEVYFSQFRAFADPKRDPRARIVSMGYIALVTQETISGQKGWFDASDLPKMAFDHRRIVSEAKAFLKENLNTLIVKQFLPELFPLNQLQRVYEIIKGEKYDNRNFRKKMINDGIVEETSRFLKNSSHRPPRLYRFRIVK